MALTVTEIQQLYTAYLGRPVDQEGVDYWTDAELDLTIADLRFNLANDDQPEYVELYGDRTREELVTAIYDNMFGRVAEEADLDYWVNGEGAAVPANELQQLFIEAASDEDSAAFEAKVQADLEAYEAGDTSELTELLNGLLNAQGDKADFIEAAAANELVAADLENRNIDLEADGTDVEQQVTTSINNVLVAAQTDVDGALDSIQTAVAAVGTNTSVDTDASYAKPATFDANMSTAVQNATLADAKAALAEATADVEAEVAGLTGLNGRINTLLTRKAQLETAIDTAAEELTDYIGDAASFSATTSVAVELQDSTNANAAVDVTAAGDIADADRLVLGGSVVAATKDSEGKWTFDTSVTLPTGATEAGVKGLIASLQTATTADRAETTATTNLETAIERVVQAEQEDSTIDISDFSNHYDATGTDAEGNAVVDLTLNDSNITAGEEAPISQLLIDLRDAKAELDAAEADLTAGRELTAELSGLDDAIEDARDALADAEFEVVELDGADYAGTEADDVFLFADQKGADYSIDLFGEQGQDRIFFGEGFELVALGDDEITDRVGSATQKEVFWEQDGENLVLFVEAEAAAGTDLNTNELTQITLTGVSFEDIDFAGGYLSAGTIA